MGPRSVFRLFGDPKPGVFYNFNFMKFSVRCLQRPQTADVELIFVVFWL